MKLQENQLYSLFLSNCFFKIQQYNNTVELRFFKRDV